MNIKHLFIWLSLWHSSKYRSLLKHTERNEDSNKKIKVLKLNLLGSKIWYDICNLSYKHYDLNVSSKIHIWKFNCKYSAIKMLGL